MAKSVDPMVYDLAASFIDDLLQHELLHAQRPVPARDVLVQRAAEAMQQAIEDECEEIRRSAFTDVEERVQ